MGYPGAELDYAAGGRIVITVAASVLPVGLYRIENFWDGVLEIVRSVP
jgi:hypothetical protein